MSKALLIRDYVDENLKVVRDEDGNDTPLEISKDTLKVKGQVVGVTGDFDVVDGNIGISGGKLLLLDERKGGDGNFLTCGAGGTDDVKIYVGGTNLLRLFENGGGANDKIIIPAQSLLMFDDGSNTYITESSADKLEIVVGGDEMLTLDEANQRVTIEADKLVYKTEGGTNKEFSPTDSAYAGMILGYTRIANTASGVLDAILALTTTMSVLQTAQGTDVSVTFVAPPSGNVEIIFTCYLYTSSTTVAFALSDNASFNEVDPDHTYDMGSYRMDETDRNTISTSWAVTGLTAGTSYTYYVAGDEISGTTAIIYHGDSRGTGDHYPPITVKAIALPATITTGS